MELWLRYKEANNLEKDKKVNVTSKKEWYDNIYDPKIISSILWPNSDLFHLDIKHILRKHKHEHNYYYSKSRNLSYLLACKKIANQIESKYGNSNCLVYAPLRGALPIWKAISQFLKSINIVVYYPVTSSFIFYPSEFGILNSKNKTASARYNNRFELQRLKPFLNQFDYLIYVDEIISGSMMWGHLKDMFRLKINQQIPIITIGLADEHGKKSEFNRKKIESLVEKKKLHSFIWKGCDSLITEDQKFLLGVHFVDYKLGPHIVPFLNENLNKNEGTHS